MMKNLQDTIGHSSPPVQAAEPRAPRPKSPPPFLSQFYGVRRVAGKLARRFRKLAGRPDNSPWVLRPRGRAACSTFVDFLIGLDYLSPNSRLVELFHEAWLEYVRAHRDELATIFRETQEALAAGDVERLAQVSLNAIEPQIDDLVAGLPK